MNPNVHTISPAPPPQPLPEHCCGRCVHFHRLPKDPMDLGQAARGECREGPPHASGIPQPHGIATFVIYPQMPDNFPACSRFALKLALATG